jgi:hypothetical protein
MRNAPGRQTETNAPRKPKQRHSYDENLDEPAKLIENEPVDAERGTPEEENDPIENVERDEPSGPPAFEDDESGGR